MQISIQGQHGDSRVYGYRYPTAQCPPRVIVAELGPLEVGMGTVP